jgi:RNA polymerase sigma factor (sigma-70 family)
MTTTLATSAGRDADLVERLRRQEARAMEELVAVYGDRTYRLAMNITGNSSDAEEVVQDALWAAIRKIDTFRGTAAFGSWVYRIAANAAYQKRRGRRIERNATSWDEYAPTFDETGRHVEPGVDWSPRLTDPALQPSCNPCSAPPSTNSPRSTARPFSCATSKGSRTPRSRRRCRSS